MPSSGANNEKNQRSKRRKIEIKEVVQSDRRNVTFSKRKLGLFNKLTELSVLCQVETALIITSKNGKLYSCGYPDADAVIRRYINRGPPQRLDGASKKKEQEVIETLRLEYEATQNHLKEEQKRLLEMKEIQNSSFCFHPWWSFSTDDMSLENLEQFKNSLERLKSNLVAALQGKQLNSVPSMPSSSSSSSTVAPPITSFVGTNYMYLPDDTIMNHNSSMQGKQLNSVPAMPSSSAIVPSVTSFVGTSHIYSPQKTILIEPNRTIMSNNNSSMTTLVPPIPYSTFPPTQSAMVPPMPHTMVQPMSQFSNMSLFNQ